LTVKVGINGFGRIGRGFFRAALTKPDLEIVAINDLTSPDTLAHLLKYDTVMGRFEGKIEAGEGSMTVNGKKMVVMSDRDPGNLPWSSHGADIVIESTGFFRTPEGASKHMQGGAKKVIVSAPAKGEMFTVVPGVNEDQYNPDEHHLISNASCTTNCLAPLVKVLDTNFGIETGLMTTIHAVTNDQRMLDMLHSDLRRTRAACWNLIPTTTGAAKAIGLVYPKLDGKLNGMAVRAPVMDGSLVDLCAYLEQDFSIEAVNEAFKKASQEGPLAPYLVYTDEPLVSSDFIGNPASCTFDSLATLKMGKMVKVLGWYDNEVGYSNRLADLAVLIGNKL
jgi:glyceraldehyde 3-phosphate dehydrogenase